MATKHDDSCLQKAADDINQAMTAFRDPDRINDSPAELIDAGRVLANAVEDLSARLVAARALADSLVPTTVYFDELTEPEFHDNEQS